MQGVVSPNNRWGSTLSLWETEGDLCHWAWSLLPTFLLPAGPPVVFVDAKSSCQHWAESWRGWRAQLPPQAGATALCVLVAITSQIRKRRHHRGLSYFLSSPSLKSKHFPGINERISTTRWDRRKSNFLVGDWQQRYARLRDWPRSHRKPQLQDENKPLIPRISGQCLSPRPPVSLRKTRGYWVKVHWEALAFLPNTGLARATFLLLLWLCLWWDTKNAGYLMQRI